jgi:hypothetical protein
LLSFSEPVRISLGLLCPLRGMTFGVVEQATRPSAKPLKLVGEEG